MVLSRSQFKQDFEQIIQELETMYNTYIQEQLTYPALDTLSLHYTYLFLTSLECSKEKRQIYSVSQSLIQLGLDSHDQVENRMLNNEVELTKQQLTVLSGDLFSGYYYYYLATKNEIELIKLWSKVIQEINIQKTDLHLERKKISSDEIKRRQSQFEKLLTQGVLTWFGADSFWWEMYSLAKELHFAIRNDRATSEVAQLSLYYEEKLYACPENWLKDELSLWLDLAREEKADVLVESFLQLDI